MLCHALRVTREDTFPGIVQVLPLQTMKVAYSRCDLVDFQQAGHRVGVAVTGARIDFTGQVQAGATQYEDTQHCRENQQHYIFDNGHGEELLMTLH